MFSSGNYLWGAVAICGGIVTILCIYKMREEKEKRKRRGDREKAAERCTKHPEENDE